MYGSTSGRLINIYYRPATKEKKKIKKERCSDPEITRVYPSLSQRNRNGADSEGSLVIPGHLVKVQLVTSPLLET